MIVEPSDQERAELPDCTASYLEAIEQEHKQMQDLLIEFRDFANSGRSFNYPLGSLQKLHEALEDIGVPKKTCHPDWQNTSICNDCGKPMKGAKS